MASVVTRGVIIGMWMVGLLGGGVGDASAQSASAPRYRPVASGHVRPFYLAGVADTGVRVPGFLLAERAVSNADFLRFVKANPGWRRSRVPRIAADPTYLRHWESDTVLGATAAPSAPVVHVSWFAAQAYAQWSGARLPSTAEWELAASRFVRSVGPTPERLQTFLIGSYAQAGTEAGTEARPSPSPASDEGIAGLHGGPWEWVDDFNSVVTSGESRGDGTPDDGLFCAGGAALAADPGNFAAFMRYAVRGSLRGSYALGTLGFRLARDPSPPSGRPDR